MLCSCMINDQHEVLHHPFSSKHSHSESLPSPLWGRLSIFSRAVMTPGANQGALQPAACQRQGLSEESTGGRSTRAQTGSYAWCSPCTALHGRGLSCRAPGPGHGRSKRGVRLVCLQCRCGRNESVQHHAPDARCKVSACPFRNACSCMRATSLCSVSYGRLSSRSAASRPAPCIARASFAVCI